MVVALKSDNTVVSEGKKFARDYISLRATGMTFTELMALGDAIIEVKDTIIEGKEAEIIRKDAIIDAKDAIIAAEIAAKALLIEKFIENIKGTNLNAIHGMVKADFSIEKIADILGFDIDYVKKLAAIEPN
jgi:isopropylmalate/homocitrate/citramalate synthase